MLKYYEMIFYAEDNIADIDGNVTLQSKYKVYSYYKYAGVTSSKNNILIR